LKAGFSAMRADGPEEGPPQKLTEQQVADLVVFLADGESG
jgi:hypothetical protein